MDQSPPSEAQLVKTFPAFYGTRRFSTVFTRYHHGPYPELDESDPHPPLFS
jgi:hypothetical protein